jgi:hypothetical protein
MNKAQSEDLNQEYHASDEVRRMFENLNLDGSETVSSKFLLDFLSDAGI